MNKHRLSAFTLMEVTIGLLISAIVIGVAYTTFSIVVRFYSVYHQKNMNMANLIRINELLKNDFRQADQIFKTPEGLSFRQNNQETNYIFEPDFCLRIGSVTDTFKFHITEMRISFEEKEVTEQGRVDELQLTLLYDQQKFPYHYFKQYSATDLFAPNTNANY